MLSTFTKIGGGTLIIRSEDIKAIEDGPDDICTLGWMFGDRQVTTDITGTALENLAHIQREELDGIDRVASYQEAQQRRQMEGFPAVPVPRGKIRQANNG